MSLHPQEIPDIPVDTVRVAKAAHLKGNTFMWMRDELGSFYQDQDFAALFPNRGQSALAPWRLALVSIMQFAEGLTDRQAHPGGTRLCVVELTGNMHSHLNSLTPVLISRSCLNFALAWWKEAKSSFCCN